VKIPSGAGNAVVFTVTGTALSSLTGNLVNTATVTAPAGTSDPTPSNNSSTDSDTAALVADLGIVKTDESATVVPGTSITPNRDQYRNSKPRLMPWAQKSVVFGVKAGKDGPAPVELGGSRFGFKRRSI
jgi:hypothetical protein